jgi:hypothetical protein
VVAEDAQAAIFRLKINLMNVMLKDVLKRDATPQIALI